MLCKYCGMDSATTDKCSWCHRPLSTSGTHEGARPAPAPFAPTGEEERRASSRSGRLPALANTGGRTPAFAGAAGTSDGGAHRPAPGVPLPPPPAGRAPLTAVFAEKTLSRSGSRSLEGFDETGKQAAREEKEAGKTAVLSSRAVEEKSHAASVSETPIEKSQSRTGGLSHRVAVPTALLNKSGSEGGTGGLNAAQAPSTGGSGPLNPAARPSGGTGPLKAGTGSLAGKAAPAEPTRAMSARTPVEEEESGGLAAGKSAPVRASTPTRLPTMELPGTQPSKYYGGQVVDPVSGKAFDPATGKEVSPTEVSKPGDVVLHWDEPGQVAMPTALARYAGILVGLLAVAGLAAHLIPAVFAIPMIVAQFAGAMLLPILRVAPWQDEDSDDVPMFVLMTLVFGPGIALVVYGVLAAVRQSFNPAVLGMLIVTLLARVVTAWAAHSPSLTQLAPWNIHSVGDWPVLLLNWSGIVALAGWFTAGFFHKLHE